VVRQPKTNWESQSYTITVNKFRKTKRAMHLARTVMLRNKYKILVRIHEELRKDNTKMESKEKHCITELNSLWYTLCHDTEPSDWIAAFQ
jgi:hypothetical protein